MRPIPVPRYFFLFLLAFALPDGAAVAADPLDRNEPTFVAATEGAPVETTMLDEIQDGEVAEIPESVAADEPRDDAVRQATDATSLLALLDMPEEAAVCKEYGEVCRRDKQCCAPMRCAFDGYLYYCRY